MNLILFEPSEIERPLPRPDRRAQHVLQILRRQPGDSFDAGVIDGPRGKATLVAVTADALSYTFVPTDPPPAPEPVALLVGLPRPQTARDILRDATSAGVAALHFFRAEKSEASYAQSALWSGGEWRRHVLAGAEQAFATRLPAVTHAPSLAAALAALAPNAPRIALDNYEAAGPLSEIVAAIRPDALPHLREQPALLAIGSERGWSAAERTALRDAGFALAHLGPRVLRTEAAVLTAIALARARLSLL